LRWFKAPNQFCSHVMNAFDDGTRVYIDVPRADSNMFPCYIVQVATRIKEMRTDVFLLDALHIDRGSIATIRRPLRLRPGYHGSWAPSEALPPF
jgi:carotenoid cleavage dioxygenase-like enzyme